MLRHLPLVLLAVSAAMLPAEEAMPKPKPKPIALPLLQTIAWSGVPHAITVNGFPVKALRSVKPHLDAIEGFATPMARYQVLHPYFLRTTGNRVEATYQLETSFVADDDAGPWRLDLRAAVVDWDGKPDHGVVHIERELGRFVSPDLTRADADVSRTLTGTFDWVAPVPTWSWTTGIRIEDSEATRKSLYAAYVSLHADLAAQRAAYLAKPDDTTPPPLVAAMAGTMREFIQASERRGVPYVLHEELVYAAQHLSLREYDREMAETSARLAKQPPKTPEQLAEERKPKLERGDVAAYDTPISRDPEPDADGKLPPRLTLAPLPAFDQVKLALLAGGTIARLTVADTDAPLVSFFSNYADGPRGRRYSTKLEADVWFRRDASGAWVIDAMWPETSAVEHWGTLGQTLEVLHY